MNVNGTNAPGVTVLMPVHGDAPFLAAAIESSLSQELNADCELLLILDRPSARAEQLVQASVGGRIRAVASRSDGLVAALNTGLQEAKFEFIARMDADDIMLPMRLARQRDVLVLQQNTAAVGGQVRIIDGIGTIDGRRRYPVAPFWIRFQLRFRNSIAHPAVMYRRSDVIEAGGYRADFAGAEDYDLWYRLSRFADLRNLGVDVLEYRVHGGQLTQSRKRLVVEATYAVQRNAWRLRTNGVGQFLLNAATLAVDTSIWAIRRIAMWAHRA